MDINLQLLFDSYGALKTSKGAAEFGLKCLFVLGSPCRITPTVKATPLKNF